MQILDIEHKVKSVLSEYKYTHSLNTAKLAIKISEKYNENIEKAYKAGILHDYAKQYNEKEIMCYANFYKIKVDEYQRLAPIVLHGLVGAELVRDEFKIFDEDILNSIRYHALGRKNMSKLEKIIFLADYLEVGRNHSEFLADLRKMVFVDLEKTLLFVFDKRLSYLISNNKIIHQNTIEAWNSLIITNNNYYTGGLK